MTPDLATELPKKLRELSLILPMDLPDSDWRILNQAADALEALDKRCERYQSVLAIIVAQDPMDQFDKPTRLGCVCAMARMALEGDTMSDRAFTLDELVDQVPELRAAFEEIARLKARIVLLEAVREAAEAYVRDDGPVIGTAVRAKTTRQLEQALSAAAQQDQGEHDK